MSNDDIQNIIVQALCYYDSMRTSRITEEATEMVDKMYAEYKIKREKGSFRYKLKEHNPPRYSENFPNRDDTLRDQADILEELRDTGYVIGDVTGDTVKLTNLCLGLFEKRYEAETRSTQISDNLDIMNNLKF